jgi:hypothetical protein
VADDHLSSPNDTDLLLCPEQGFSELRAGVRCDPDRTKI